MSDQKNIGPKSAELLRFIYADVMDKDILLWKLYGVHPASSERARSSAKTDINKMVQRLRGIGYRLVNDTKRIYFIEDY